MAKRLICLLLVCIMALAIFVGCTQDPEATDTNGATDGASDVIDNSQETESQTEMITDKWGQESLVVGIPEELDYEGADFGILMRNVERFNREFGNAEFVANASALDAKIYERNMKVEKDLNVNLYFAKDLNGGNNDEFYNAVMNAKQADSADYEVIAAYAAYGVAPTIRGAYSDLNNSDDFTYLASTQKYWNQSYIESATLNNKLYYITGDVNLSTFDRSIVVYFNESLCTTYGITGLYDTALAGEWTYDMLFNYANNIPSEEMDTTNGKSDGDQHTLVTMRHSEECDGFLAAFNLPVLAKGDDGRYVGLMEGNVKMATAAQKVYDLFSAAGSYVAGSTAIVNDRFATGNALFAVDIMYRSDAQNSQYREMTDSYGILPLPMYDSDQYDADSESLGYRTTPQDAYNIMSAMNTSKVNSEMVSAVLELMCSESYNEVRPYYFEKMVKSKYFAGLKSAKVFELVLSSVVFDTGIVYNGQLGGVAVGVWRDACHGKAFDEVYAEQQTVYEEALIDFEDWIFG